VTQPETEAPAGATGATAGEDAAAKAPATTSNADTAAAPPAPEAPPAAAAAPPPPPSNGASAGEVRLKLFARTDVGQIREHNEDNFLVADLSKRSRGLLESNRVASVGPFGHLFAVCDGMGGAAAGEVASQLAVDIIYERMVDGLDQKTEIRRDDIARRLVRAVETAGFRIFQEAKADRSRRGMGTTVTAAALVDDHLFFAQVGDSRGYILRDGALTQVTRDQSLVNQLIEAGQLTAEEAETFEHNNIILQALGTSDTVQVDLTFVEVRPGDVMLLCSDGLSGMVRFDEIRETMRTAGEPVDVCKALTERANLAGGHDNITVIIVAFEGDGLKVASSGGDAEPLKYRKYSLPEEVAEGTERHRRPPPEPGSPAASQDKARASDRPLPADDALSAATGGPRSAKSRSDGWHEEGPHGSPANGDESIDIPGTHVPPGVVVAIVLGVVAVLAATALVLLR
jgi:serine/threonine protein phosphatase PrpC